MLWALIRCIMCHCDSYRMIHRFVSGSLDYHMRVFDFGGMDGRRKAFRSIEVDENHPITSIAHSPTGDRLIVATGSCQPKVASSIDHMLFWAFMINLLFPLPSPLSPPYTWLGIWQRMHRVSTICKRWYVYSWHGKYQRPYDGSDMCGLAPEGKEHSLNGLSRRHTTSMGFGGTKGTWASCQ